MSNFFSIIIGEKEDEEKMKNPYVSSRETQELPRFTAD